MAEQIPPNPKMAELEATARAHIGALTDSIHRICQEELGLAVDAMASSIDLMTQILGGMYEEMKDNVAKEDQEKLKKAILNALGRVNTSASNQQKTLAGKIIVTKPRIIH